MDRPQLILGARTSAEASADHSAEREHLDTYLRLTAAFAEVGLRLHVSTLVRWIKHGRQGIHLEAKRIGGRWYTSRRAVLAFINSGAAESGPSPSPNLTVNGAAGVRAERTAAELDRLGF